MADHEIDEREALTALLESDGWALLMRQLDQQYGAEAYARQIDGAIVEARKSGSSAEQDIGELGAACRAVRLFAQWPAKRLADLKRATDKPTGFLARRRA